MERIVGIVLAMALIAGVYGIGLVVDDDSVGGAADRGALASAEPDGDADVAVDDRGLSLLANGHQHSNAAEVELDAATQAQLDAQLALTREVADRFPDIAAAVAAGYRRAGPFAPGLGIHYTKPSSDGLNFDGVMTEAELLSPLAIIFDGTEPDAPIAGFMYYSMSAEAPEGFAGPNDHWHYHDNVCLVTNPDGTQDAPLGADREVTEEQCAALGGGLLPVTQWMVHVWTIPGYESDHGVFSEVNPAIDCPDGTYYQISEEEQLRAPLSNCRSGVA
ncbi:MAG TPA: hypothetical protein VFZ83_12845 [Acidimicrobiia bacterium]|nr:hypothetical protein [Acidimicrobiia bacterium]